MKGIEKRENFWFRVVVLLTVLGFIVSVAFLLSQSQLREAQKDLEIEKGFDADCLNYLNNMPSGYKFVATRSTNEWGGIEISCGIELIKEQLVEKKEQQSVPECVEFGYGHNWINFDDKVECELVLDQSKNEMCRCEPETSNDATGWSLHCVTESCICYSDELCAEAN